MSNFVELSIFLTLGLVSMFSEVHGLQCENFGQYTGSRKVSTCPTEDNFCISYEYQYFAYDDYTSDAGWNIVREYLGCESVLDEHELNGFERDICETEGEGCHEGITDNDGNDYYSDTEWKVCCCKEDMCNERNTTTTGTVSSTEPTTTTTGLVCEGFEQETNTRRIMACPDGDEFCIALENKFVVYERDPDGNPTSEVAQNITQEYYGCESDLGVVSQITPDICQTIGEDCAEGEIESDNDIYSVFEWNVCCCKGNMCNKRGTQNNNSDHDNRFLNSSN